MKREKVVYEYCNRFAEAAIALGLFGAIVKGLSMVLGEKSDDKVLRRSQLRGLLRLDKRRY